MSTVDSVTAFFALPFCLTAERSIVSTPSVELRETALPLPVLVDRSKGLELDQTALKPGVVLGPQQLAFEAGRGDLQGVLGPGDEVFDVEDGAEVLCEVLRSPRG